MEKTFTTLCSSRDAVPDHVDQFTVYDEQSGKRVATVFDRNLLPVFTAAPTMRELLEDALPCVEESEQFHKPTCRELSKKIRALLSETGPTT